MARLSTIMRQYDSEIARSQRRLQRKQQNIDLFTSTIAATTSYATTKMQMHQDHKAAVELGESVNLTYSEDDNAFWGMTDEMVAYRVPYGLISSFSKNPDNMAIALDGDITKAWLNYDEGDPDYGIAPSTTPKKYYIPTIKQYFDNMPADFKSKLVGFEMEGIHNTFNLSNISDSHPGFNAERAVSGFGNPQYFEYYINLRGDMANHHRLDQHGNILKAATITKPFDESYFQNQIDSHIKWVNEENELTLQKMRLQPSNTHLNRNLTNKLDSNNDGLLDFYHPPKDIEGLDKDLQAEYYADFYFKPEDMNADNPDFVEQYDFLFYNPDTDPYIIGLRNEMNDVDTLTDVPENVSAFREWYVLNGYMEADKVPTGKWSKVDENIYNIAMGDYSEFEDKVKNFPAMYERINKIPIVNYPSQIMSSDEIYLRGDDDNIVYWRPNGITYGMIENESGERVYSGDITAIDWEEYGKTNFKDLGFNEPVDGEVAMNAYMQHLEKNTTQNMYENLISTYQAIDNGGTLMDIGDSIAVNLYGDKNGNYSFTRGIGTTGMQTVYVNPFEYHLFQKFGDDAIPFIMEKSQESAEAKGEKWPILHKDTGHATFWLDKAIPILSATAATLGIIGTLAGVGATARESRKQKYAARRAQKAVRAGIQDTASIGVSKLTKLKDDYSQYIKDTREDFTTEDKGLFDSLEKLKKMSRNLNVGNREDVRNVMDQYRNKFNKTSKEFKLGYENEARDLRFNLGQDLSDLGFELRNLQADEREAKKTDTFWEAMF